MTETFLSPLKRGHWIIKATENLLETVIIIIEIFLFAVIPEGKNVYEQILRN